MSNIGGIVKTVMQIAMLTNYWDGEEEEAFGDFSIETNNDGVIVDASMSFEMEEGSGESVRLYKWSREKAIDNPDRLVLRDLRNRDNVIALEYRRNRNRMEGRLREDGYEGDFTIMVTRK